MSPSALLSPVKRPLSLSPQRLVQQRAAHSNSGGAPEFLLDGNQENQPATLANRGRARLASTAPRHPVHPRTAQLLLVMGPMFAGKTTTLLEMVQEREAQNERVAIVTSAKDNRYAASKCVTHTGVARDAIAVERLLDLFRPAPGPAQPSGNTTSAPGTNEKLLDLSQVDVIAIDESQFFPDLLDFCQHVVDDCGKTVIAAGLNGDFQRHMFGDLVKLVPHADHVHLLKARCFRCEEPAPFTLRLVDDDSQELVGGGDVYQPVCRKHYRSLSPMRKLSAGFGPAPQPNQPVTE